ncbi:myc-associated zinc finger -like isoform X1 [Labeo rohita]|uniref:Myc-associated zinc finger-like isoform X1 n=1 Tax=Labeo rohita TaxID=84645 RepID=A0A498P6E8_LABRO|nr:myc-associated zinc finger -like isoform X1 [Labeo rohita]
MDAAWSNFLFQTTPSQTQVEGSLQSELLTSPQTPPTDHIAPPPSTVDTAALNEDPVPEQRKRCRLEYRRLVFSRTSAVLR